MMQTTTILCDNCGHDLTFKSYGFVLANRNGETADLCGHVCIRRWLDKLTDAELAAIAEINQPLDPSPELPITQPQDEREQQEQE